MAMSPTKKAPVVQLASAPAGGKAHKLRMGFAVFFSIATHAVLIALFILAAPANSALPVEPSFGDIETLTADPEEALPRATFDSIMVDPTGLNMGGDIANDSQRTTDFVVPGLDDPRANPGEPNGSDANLPINLSRPPGFVEGPGGTNDSVPGGNGPSRPGWGGGLGKNPYQERAKFGNSGGAGAMLGQPGTGSSASDAAVRRGLECLVRQQSPDGRWMLDGMFKDKGSANDTAGTALGLLPFLGAGKTQKASKDNPFDKTVGKALRFLMSRQDLKRGDLGGGMYGHGIATIALCEAYGLTQAPNLRLAAQRAVNFIVYAQHEKGGWRYSPGQEGDMSVTGWQIMALKSAQMAGLDVPASTLKKAERFLDSFASPTTEGYGYIDSASTPTTSAVGLLCRQFMQGWGPQNPRLIKGISANLKPVPPGAKKDAYYYYYATQVMYHFGGESWTSWNQKMRDHLVETQAADKASADFGSWSSAGDTWSASGGRLMVTSLNLLTLEVYYRYLPLYQRESVAGR
jgi:hypothetical protein